MKRIFISYRRSDSAGHAGRLYDHLKIFFGDERIFFDVSTIDPGTDFEQEINSELDGSDVVLVLIGKQWLDASDKNGMKRLDNPHDYVRLEVETALKKNTTVIPILLQGADMPSRETLPSELAPLSRRNAIRINDDHWDSDFQFMTLTLKGALGISMSLKERRKLTYLKWIVLTAGLSIVLTIFDVFVFSSNFLSAGIGSTANLLKIIAYIVNLVLVTYFIGNIEPKLNKIGLVIIIYAGVALLLAAIGDFVNIWSTLALLLMLGILYFGEVRG